MLQLGNQFLVDNKECVNVPRNGDPMCKRQRTYEIAAAIPQMPARTNSKFKTHFCAKFRLGNCRYGNKCQFSHGIQEMRKRLPVPVIDNNVLARNWNGNCRKLCRMFYMGKRCTYGENCCFLHVNPETSGYGNSKPWLKRKLCNIWESTGSCQFGNICIFAHGQAELEKPDCHITLVSGSIQMNTAHRVSTGKAGVIQTTRKPEQVQGRNFISKLKTSQKLSGIYADWIEDESFFHNLLK
ncbi:zinc finger CCCH domain-containing protein 56-like [Euphorbia lathyris]|uniref:zinc finger CCCH domain-containing protein 56-like n=1 Tax=Euphorbia lathyris TaxID=212925 RepID=UPI003314107B